MESNRTGEPRGRRRRSGRSAVRLDARALWARLALLKPLPELACPTDWHQLRLHVQAGGRRPRALRPHPPKDARGPRNRGLQRALQAR